MRCQIVAEVQTLECLRIKEIFALIESHVAPDIKKLLAEFQVRFDVIDLYIFSVHLLLSYDSCPEQLLLLSLTALLRIRLCAVTGLFVFFVKPTRGYFRLPHLLAL